MTHCDFADVHSFGGNWLARQYIMRAQFAASYARSATRVLDIACGSGYNTFHLARANARAEVVGIDLSPAAVACASSLYAAPNLSFEEGDVFALRHPEASFDLVVSFETIEHVLDGNGFVRGLMKILRPDGTLLISTPHDDWAIPMRQHVKTYQPEEFFAMLSRLFEEVEPYFQFQSDQDRAIQMRNVRIDRWRRLKSLPIRFLAAVTPRVLKDARRRRLGLGAGRVARNIEPFHIAADDLHTMEEVTSDTSRPGAHAHILVAVCRKPRLGG